MEKSDAIGLDVLYWKGPDGSPCAGRFSTCLIWRNYAVICSFVCKRFDPACRLKPQNLNMWAIREQHKNEPPHAVTWDQQFVIATEPTPIIVVAASSFFHPFAAAC